MVTKATAIRAVPVVRAVLALGSGLVSLGAHADHVFQFAPFAVTAPDSRTFGNSTIGSPGLLTVGTISPDPQTGPAQYNFLDTWNFSLSADADLIGFVGSINFTNALGDITFGINNLQLALTGPQGAVAGWSSAINFVGAQQLFSIVTQQPFAAGDYSLRVRGLLVGPQSSYAGTLQAINSVPLPPALNLLAAGLVLLGFCARRQRTNP